MRIIDPIGTPPHTLEDPLAYLPHSSIIAFKKGQIIYQQIALELYTGYTGNRQRRNSRLKRSSDRTESHLGSTVRNTRLMSRTS